MVFFNAKMFLFLTNSIKGITSHITSKWSFTVLAFASFQIHDTAYNKTVCLRRVYFKNYKSYSTLFLI